MNAALGVEVVDCDEVWIVVYNARRGVGGGVLDVCAEAVAGGAAAFEVRLVGR